MKPSILEGEKSPYATLTPSLRKNMTFSHALPGWNPTQGITALLLVATLALTACDSSTMSDTLGLNRTAPDEFTVVSRPSLSVPPEFSLRPPRPGEPPRGASADEQARAALLGKEAKPQETIDSIREPNTPSGVTPVLESPGGSAGSDALLKRAGAENAKDDIRDQLGGDAAAPNKTESKSLLEKLSGGKQEPVVDAKKEAERLRNNKDSGKPATEGETPIDKSKPSVLDRIF